MSSSSAASSSSSSRAPSSGCVWCILGARWAHPPTQRLLRRQHSAARAQARRRLPEPLRAARPGGCPRRWTWRTRSPASARAASRPGPSRRASCARTLRSSPRKTSDRRPPPRFEPAPPLPPVAPLPLPPAGPREALPLRDAAPGDQPYGDGDGGAGRDPAALLRGLPAAPAGEGAHPPAAHHALLTRPHTRAHTTRSLCGEAPTGARGPARFFPARAQVYGFASSTSMKPTQMAYPGNSVNQSAPARAVCHPPRLRNALGGGATPSPAP